jgi:hypothetical protein
VKRWRPSWLTVEAVLLALLTLFAWAANIGALVFD